MSVLNRFTSNASTVEVRHETLEGRKMRVVPMVMLKEAVLNGSRGPVYYPPEEIAKMPLAWNHKPVVVYHPTINGRGISACDPVVIETQKIGLILNTRWVDGKLSAEAWIDVEKANRVDSRVMEAVENQAMMEVSTGLFCDNEEVEGEFGGKAYSKVARNFNPDHLAILPDKTGALSIEDGAGLLRNELKEELSNIENGELLARRFMSFINSGMSTLYLNEVSLGDRLDRLYRAVREATNDEGWLVDAFSDYVIVALDEKLFKISYAISDSSVTITEDRMEVTKEISYTPVVTGNQQTPSVKGNFSMNKTALIAGIATLLHLNNEEAETLKDLPESLLEKNLTILQAVPAPPAEPATIDAVIEGAPERFKGPLRNGLAAYENQRKELIGKIMAVENQKLTAEFLENQNLDGLTAIASLIPAPPAEPVDPTTTNNQSQPAKFVGLAGVADGVVMNAEDADIDMIPKGMSFEPAK